MKKIKRKARKRKKGKSDEKPLLKDGEGDFDEV